MPDYIEVTRWVRFVPDYDRNGQVRGATVAGMTVQKPNPLKGGPMMRVTFRIPKTIFGPVANVVVELDESNFDGTPEIIAAELRELRDSL